MTVKRIRQLIVVVLATCILMSSTCGCGSSSVQTSSQESEVAQMQTTEPIGLTDKEFVFHGVHMLIPDVFTMKQNENNADIYSSEWIGTPPEGYMPGSLYVSLAYNSESQTWDTALGDEYSPYSARIYYAEGSYESRIADEWVLERKRLNGVDVLIQTRPVTVEEGKNPVVATETYVTVILQSCVVQIEFRSLTKQFDELFEKCINSIHVDEDQIPDLVKQTEPVALQKAGLTTQAWAYNNLYIHVPDTYTLVKTDDDQMAWFSEKELATIYFSVGNNKELLSLSEDEWYARLANVTGFQEVTYSSNGNMNSMYYGFVSYRALQNDQLLRADTIILLPDRYGDEVVMMSYIYMADDTETDELGTRMLNVVHHADGWKGEGLLETEPITMDEFKARLGE